MANHKQTVLDGLKSVPHVSEIITIFSNAPTDHFITHFALYKDKPVKWNTVVYFGGRYILTYQVDVMVDYRKNKILKTINLPSINLSEISKVRDGGGGTYNSSNEVYFSEAEWGKIVKAHGDFSAAGIKLTTNAPIAGFDEYVRQWRESRIE